MHQVPPYPIPPVLRGNVNLSHSTATTYNMTPNPMPSPYIRNLNPQAVRYGVITGPFSVDVSVSEHGTMVQYHVNALHSFTS